MSLYKGIKDCSNFKDKVLKFILYKTSLSSIAILVIHFMIHKYTLNTNISCFDLITCLQLPSFFSQVLFTQSELQFLRQSWPKRPFVHSAKENTYT